MRLQTRARPAVARSVRAALRAPARRAGVPLYRNGYSLVANSALTSALGLVYWLVAARAYSTVAVGVGSALISVTVTIANLAHLNLKSALNRFLPRAGRATFRLVIYSYLIALGVAGLAAIAFVAGVSLWSPRLAFLADRPVIGAWFVLSTMAWTVFVLEDSVLTGIRKAHWVPLENLIYAILKLAALPALVLVTPLLGTFVSWTAALPPIVLAVNLLLFRRLLPAHERATTDGEERAGAAVIARYVAADFSAYVVLTATMGLLPVVVLSVLGPDASAYYFIAWSIAYGLYLIPSSMGMAMVSEAASDPNGLADYDRQLVIEAAKLLVPCVAVVVIAAPWLLRLLGADYADGGTTLLRLLVLSALPWTVFASYTNTARVQRRMSAIVRATAVLFGLVLAIGVPLMQAIGLDGLGVGWLAAQTLVAAGIALERHARRRWPGMGEPTAGALLRDPALRALTTAGDRWRHLRRRSDDTVRAIVAELAQPDHAWITQRDVPTLNDLSISVVGPVGREPAAVVKCARGRAGRGALRRHARALRELDGLGRLAEWRALVPRIVADHVLGEDGCLVETCLPGTTMEARLRDGADAGRMVGAAARAIAPLHEATSRPDRVDEELIAELVDRPLQHLRATVAGRRHPRRRRRAERLCGDLRAALGGVRLTTGRVHGDLSPCNVLIGGDGAATGIVDWERSRARGLRELDLLQLVIATRVVLERRELGSVIVEMRRHPGWRPRERDARTALRRCRCRLPTETLVLLTWLQHVSANVEKSARYAHNPLWVRRNVDPVLRTSDGAPAGHPIPASAPPRLRGRLSPAPAAVRTALSGPYRHGIALGHRLSPATVAPPAALALAVGLWAVSLPQIDPRAMTDLGLVSVLPPTFLAALAILTGGFMAEIHRSRARPWLLVAHLLTLVLFTRGTPEIVYGTLRYTWAYKHVGIVDYVLRHHGVEPTISSLGVYHDWPGFFAAAALFARLAGLDTVLGIAGWGPVFNNVLYLGALLFLFRALTRDRRVIWLSCWLFLIANWVAQDYFSPQGLAFLLYLLLLGVVLRWLRPGARAEAPGRAAAIWLAVLLLAAIVVTHALTAVMACIALAALVLVRSCNARRLLPIAVAMTAAWDLTFARPYAGANLGTTLSAVHLPWQTTRTNLASFASLSPEQALVANVARILTVAVAALAVAGALRLRREGRLDRAVIALAAAPVLLFATGNYDGELLFRIDLFAVPFLAFLAADAFAGHPLRPRAPLTTAAALAVLALFLVAYFGNDRANYVTPQEVTAARWVDAHVPPGSLLITATSCNVLDSEHYERFTCLPFSLQSRRSWSRILADPVAGLSSWMTDPAYRAAYVFLSTSQSVSIVENGGLPRGSVAAVRSALLDSPRFRVIYRNRDATVLTLAGSRSPRRSG